ncbi:MAG: restriction endonuclease subunit S, partial [Dehalococcoidales bacterium]|nr:restriction endonuclease subunit S [Dehalococcoidales bacterium]
GFRSLVPLLNRSDTMFLYYLLKTNVDYLISQASGTTFQELAGGVLKELSFLFPPLPEQQAIADVLSSLDDKIDLLRRQNKTLEAMAETIWRKMFIEDADQGWIICTINDLACHEKISIQPVKNADTIFYHYSIPAFDESQMPIEELGALIQSNKYKVTPDSILFSKLNPHREKRIWLILSSPSENSICSTEFQVIKPINRKHLLFLYGFLNYPENYDEIAASVGGTSSSHQRIDPDMLFKFRCFTPDDNTLSSYNRIVEPIYTKIVNNRNSSCVLSRLRDKLLPKLMSGEVWVKI